MKMLITRTFEKDFLSIFKSKIILNKFIDKIQTQKFIGLNLEYKKFKIDILETSMRGIIFFENNKQIYIPIFVIKKSDKKYGMNLILSKETLSILENKLTKNLTDINNKNYRIY